MLLTKTKYEPRLNVSNVTGLTKTLPSFIRGAWPSLAFEIRQFFVLTFRKKVVFLVLKMKIHPFCPPW